MIEVLLKDLLKDLPIGETIAKRRKKQGLSQTELAERLGISQQILSQYETGKRNPKLTNLIRILEVLGCEIVVRVYEQLDCWATPIIVDVDEIEFSEMGKNGDNEGGEGSGTDQRQSKDRITK